MVTATRILNLVSGLIILATGVYIHVRFVDLLPAGVRLLITATAILYFLLQLLRQTGPVARGTRCSTRRCETEPI